MARLSNIVDECLTIATAFTSINSQTYNEIGAINFKDNDKSYPMFLFDKRSVSVEVTKYATNNLPAQSTYTCRFIFVDDYPESEKTSTTLQSKQGTLMQYAEQYIAEVRRRNDSGANGFYLGSTSFESIDETHNDRLIQLTYNVEFIVNVETCTLGTFVYA